VFVGNEILSPPAKSLKKGFSHSLFFLVSFNTDIRGFGSGFDIIRFGFDLIGSVGHDVCFLKFDNGRFPLVFEELSI